MNESPWLSVSDAAEYAGYSPQTITRACREGFLRHSQPAGVGGKILLRREWVDAWLDVFATGGVPPPR